MNEDTGQSFIERCDDVTPREHRNMMRVVWILAVWALCFVAASLGVKRDLIPEGAISWLAAIVPPVLAVLVILAYVRFLREADELHRVIHYQAFAMGFGSAWLVLSAYPLLHRVGAPAVEIESFTVMVMVVVYSLWIMIGRRRYR